MPCHCANITVRREIDSLNERLTGDGQTIEGGDPSKGPLKTKGTVFPPQPVEAIIEQTALLPGKFEWKIFMSPIVSHLIIYVSPQWLYCTYVAFVVS